MVCLLGLIIKRIQPKVLGRGKLGWPTDLDSDCLVYFDYSEEAGASAGLATLSEVALVLLGWPQLLEVALSHSCPFSEPPVSIPWKITDPIASATLKAEGSQYYQELAHLVCLKDWSP